MGMNRYLAIMAAFLCMLSCTRESISGETEQFFAQFAEQPMPPSKATIAADGKFSWQPGDEIAVWYTSSSTSFSHYYNAQLTSGAGSQNATFTVSKNGIRTGYALYPASLADNSHPGLGGGSLRIVLPDTYTLADGTPSSQPMLAVNTAGENLSFYHLASLLRLTLNSVPVGTKYLRFTTDADISGAFLVTFPSTPAALPYVETEQSAQDGVQNSVTFVLPEALSAAASATLDIPHPQGSYSQFQVEALSADATTLLASASRTEGRIMSRGNWVAATLNLGGASCLASFTLTDLSSAIIPGELTTVNASVREIKLGGGTDMASGYTLEPVSVSEPGVVELIVRGNTVQVKALAPGTATIRVRAVKGDNSLTAESQVTVRPLDGVSVDVGREDMFTDWSRIISAKVISGSQEITSDELFTYEWELVPDATAQVALDGEGSSVLLKTGASTGSVTVRCTVRVKANPSLSLTGESRLTLINAQGICKGEFSVSTRDKVYFASGNLIYDIDNTQYKLCPDQLYAYSGVESMILPQYSTTYRDVFGRGVCVSGNDSYFSTHPIYIGSEATTRWDMLTKDQFDYIIKSRTTAKGQASTIGKTANARFMLAEVDGREGVILFPDSFVWPKEMAYPSRINAVAAPSYNRLTREQWEKYLESAGAVFLVGGMYGPITDYNTSTPAGPRMYDYRYICYRTKDWGYVGFNLYADTKYAYFTVDGSSADYRYMRVRPVRKITL